jgi:hypothetical protein
LQRAFAIFWVAAAPERYLDRKERDEDVGDSFCRQPEAPATLDEAHVCKLLTVKHLREERQR